MGEVLGVSCLNVVVVLGEVLGVSCLRLLHRVAASVLMGWGKTMIFLRAVNRDGDTKASGVERWGGGEEVGGGGAFILEAVHSPCTTFTILAS